MIKKEMKKEEKSQNVKGTSAYWMPVKYMLGRFLI